MVVLASWLETRNQLEKRQEKNEFNFQFRQKNFLDGKNEARISVKTEELRRKKFMQGKPLAFGITATNQISLQID